MPLGILNNIASISAENSLTLTSNALNTTLQQLSTGSRINTGADDAAGLAIANGLQANVTALTQSVSNANNGVGELQLADGALAQVTNLLNRAVTLATESATGTVSDPQRTALQAEYSSILAEINRVGGSTTYNGQAVFQNGAVPNLNAASSPSAAGTLSLGDVLTSGDSTSVTAGGTTFTYTAAATAGANANEAANGTTTLTAATALASGAVLTATRATGTTTYTASAPTTVGALITAINTGTTGGNITVAGSDAHHTGFQAVLSGGSLQVSDLNNNGDLGLVETADSNTNQITSAAGGLTLGTAITATDVLTLTRTAGAATSTYTSAAGATVGTLITAINTGTTGGNVTVAGGDAHTNYSAALVNGHLVITDLNNNADVAGAETVETTLGTTFADTVNKTLGTFATNTTATSTVQDLINAINGDSTVGAKAALVNGTLQVTDPQNRNDLAVTTTDPLLGAAVAGAPTAFTTPNTTGVATTNLNELLGSTTGLTTGTALGNGTVYAFDAGGKSFTYTPANGATIGDLISHINNPATDSAGLSAYLNSSGSLVIVDPSNSGNLKVDTTNTGTAAGNLVSPTTTSVAAPTNIFLSDATAVGSSQISVTIGALNTGGITNGTGGNAANLTNTDLSHQSDAQTALTAIDSAIANIASVRGTLGASVNRLTAASNVLNSQVQNLTSAENTITAADIPSAVANLTKYSILEQTGISALAQANQQQQLVLKLLQ